jgi:hypothetical protein
MSVLAPERPLTLFDLDRHDSPDGGGETSVPSAPASGPTLEELISGVWEGLLTGIVVSCPACGGELAPRHAAGAVVDAADGAGGECRDCGSTVS